MATPSTPHAAPRRAPVRSAGRQGGPVARARLRAPAHASRLLLLALASPAGLALAQTAAPAPAAPTTLQSAAQTVTVSGSAAAANSATVSGFGEVPLSRAPWSATVISTRQLADAGIDSVGDLTRIDAGTTDAYNPPGYWSQLSVRGYVLDARSNYRRDGLPINAETALHTANLAQLELLKGISGLQSGVSAPGGLVNLVVKRPVGTVRQATLAITQPGTVQAAVDIGDRLGEGGTLGWRLNAEAARLDPAVRDARGHRHQLAGAADARLPGGGLLEGEFEIAQQTQPSVPGFSLRGSQLPSAASIDPRINLNNQPWSLPVVFDNATWSLRYTQPLAAQTQLVVHAMRQRLRTQDRVAFPFGCSSENNYDRYCSDGSFDLYDFRSEHEQRRSDALDTSVDGRHSLAGLTHHWKAGVLLNRQTARFQDQAYNWVGTATDDGLTVVPDADPTLTDANTNRTERSAEWHAQDRIELGTGWQLWLGARHSQLQRQSERTTASGSDGLRAVDYRQSITTPWLALSWQLDPATLLYASWGQGVETQVAPNRARWANRGEPLSALRSRQTELGLKHRLGRYAAVLALFDTQRPEWADFDLASGQPTATDNCSNASPCRRAADGSWHHQGLEGEAEGAWGPFSLRGSVMWLKARREGSALAAANGLRPTNVPERSAKLQAAWNVDAVPGLALLGFVTHEGDRMVLPDNSLRTGGWTRTDLGLRYSQRIGGQAWTWRLGVDNAFDRRAWKESPYQYGHAYLYPMAPRTWHGAVQVSL